MRVYIVEYRRYDKCTDRWVSKLSQDAFCTMAEAQHYIEHKPGRPVKCTETYYQTELLEEYYIHDFPVPCERQ